MGRTVAERIEQLETNRQAVLPTDNMAEAGRKVLLSELIKMLQREAGSRTGENIEDVHDMRVAIRRMRSAFRLLKPYFRAKDVRAYNRGLRRLAWVLGNVRDLDVLLADLRAYQSLLTLEGQADLQTTIDKLDTQLLAARDELIAVLDSKSYRRFLKDFTRFVAEPINDTNLADGAVVPTQVRHILPGMIYERLAAVQAYDTVLQDADDATLHALRIEFKRLRYAVFLFEDLLGSQISKFIDELKGIQDNLGGMNDISIARARLEDLADAETTSEALSGYLANLDTRQNELRTSFADLWARFNTRKVQEKLSSAVLALH